jgi:hypothetical protein
MCYANLKAADILLQRERNVLTVRLRVLEIRAAAISFITSRYCCSHKEIDGVTHVHSLYQIARYISATKRAKRTPFKLS